MPVKRDVCRNFQRGSCKYGQGCKFLHVNPQRQQQRPNDVFSSASSFQPQKPNPYGFGVHNNSQQKPINKPFENTWSRFNPASAGTAPSSRQSENQAQPNHKCTDAESCRRIIVEDFEHERPLWKLTCYSHWKNAPCDIVGDISFEELRAAAYDDAKRSLSIQSIVDRERSLLNSKLQEFENLCKPNAVLPNLTPANQNAFPGSGPNAFPHTAQNSAPKVSSFSQLGPSLNTGFGPRPPAPSNNAFVQTSPFGVSSQTSSAFGTNTFPSERQASPFTSFPLGFGNNSFVNPVTPSAVSAQIPRATNSQSPDVFTGFSSNSNAAQVPGATNNPSPGLFLGFNSNNAAQVPGANYNPSPGLFSGFNSKSNANGEVHQANHAQSTELSGVDASIWSKTKWSPGEIPDEAPPDAVCF